MTATERDEVARTAWRTEVAVPDPAALVFVDECGTHTPMTPRSGRAPRGERAAGRAPRNHGPNVTLFAALTPARMGPALVVDGATHGMAFETDVREALVPCRRHGQTVVLDNLSVHKSTKIRMLVEEAGCRLLFVPAYSLDFTSSAQAFAKVKHRLRQSAAGTVNDLVAALGWALDAVTATDAQLLHPLRLPPSRGHLKGDPLQGWMVTPFQKATRSRIWRAASFGSG